MYDDEYAGQGGSYLIDKDGKRVRVETTAPAGQAAAPENIAVPPDAPLAPPEQLIQPTTAEV